MNERLLVFFFLLATVQGCSVSVAQPDPSDFEPIEAVHETGHTVGRDIIVENEYFVEASTTLRPFRRLKQRSRYYLDGDDRILHGGQEEYDRNGSMKQLATFADGVMHGQYVERWHIPPFRIKVRGGYRHGQQNGLWATFSATGMPRTTEQYLDGVLAGRAESFDDDGHLSNTCEYRQGLKHGKEVTYQRGVIVEHVEYKSGLRDGEYRSFYSVGPRKTQGRYVAGVPDGVWLDYGVGGSLEAFSTYKDGELDGLTVQFAANGLPHCLCHYQAGKRNGSCILFHPLVGGITRAGSYRNDARVGAWIWFGSEGVVERIAVYPE